MEVPFNMELTSGILKEWITGRVSTGSILQIISIKRMSDNPLRIQLTVSDGLSIISSAILSEEMNELVTSGLLVENSVIQVEDVKLNQVSTNKIFILDKLTILCDGTKIGYVIGFPTTLDMDQFSDNSDEPVDSNMDTTMRSEASCTSLMSIDVAEKVAEGGCDFSNFGTGACTQTAGMKVATSQHGTAEGMVISHCSTKTDSSNNSHHPMTPQFKAPVVPEAEKVVTTAPLNFIPIRDISPYLGKVAVQGRVCSKSKLRKWSNERGSGTVSSVDFLDDTDRIRLTAFNENASRCDDMLSIDTTYHVSKLSVKFADKRFNPLPHDCELTLNTASVITEVQNETIPPVPHTFTKIRDIQFAEENKIIDVIGICKHVGELSSVISKKTGSTLMKREISLLDDTNMEVILTIWDKEAENFTVECGTIIAFNSVKVSDFNGKTLSTTRNTNMVLQPTYEYSESLKQWYDVNGSSTKSRRISAGKVKVDWLVLSDSDDVPLSKLNEVFVFRAKITINYINRQNLVYRGCIICNKKLDVVGNESYHCIKCSKTYYAFKWLFSASVSIADFSKSFQAIAFGKQAEMILGKTAEQVAELESKDDDSMDELIRKCTFKSYIAKIQKKLSTLHDETRFRYLILEICNINHVEFCNFMLERIPTYENTK